MAKRLTVAWILLSSAAVFSTTVVGLATARPTQDSATPSIASPTRVVTLRGPGSCAASACHGAVAPIADARILGNEYTTWVSHDPHAQAYQTLLGAQSQAIAKRLAARAEPLVPAHQDQRCLACHTTVQVDASSESFRFDTEGVTCESCHGHADRWLGPHRTAGWRTIGDAVKTAQYGMKNTTSVVSRAQVCVDCHVGSPASSDGPLRDVNHDLIAAGHPRLNFEFAAFHDILPHHWQTAGEDARPDSSVRAWAIGQLATARAALTLARDRAIDTARPWPEFTEYACFSCHHELRDHAWRHGRSGTPEWGSWPFALERDWGRLGASATGEADAGTISAVENVRKLMNERPRDRAPVVEACTRAIDALDTALASKSLEGLVETRVVAWIQHLQSENSAGHAAWDRQAQRYLALVAAYQSWRALAPNSGDEQETLKRWLEATRGRLQFPSGYLSPKHFTPIVAPATR